MIAFRDKIKIGLPFEGANPISQFFGENGWFYSRWKLKGHNGIDFAVDRGTPIRAVCDGKVYWVNDDKDGYGIYVAQRSKDFDLEGKMVRLDIVYGHMLRANVVLGDEVKRGEVVGYADNTGISTGDHLHLGIRLRDTNDVVIDYDNGYLGYFDFFPLFEELPSWFNYKLWKQKSGQVIDEWEVLPANKKYGSNLNEFELMKILPWTSWVWMFARIKRFPTNIELFALTAGRWDYGAVFKNRVSDWWQYYIKDQYEFRIKNNLGL